MYVGAGLYMYTCYKVTVSQTTLDVSISLLSDGQTGGMQPQN